MGRRLLVLKAGSGASNNLIHSLKAGDPSLFIAGSNHDRFVLTKSPADRNYLVPRAEQPEFVAALHRIIGADGIELVIPNSEADVETISKLRDRLPGRTFLPKQAVIERCQDKYRLTTFLRAKGLPVPRTYAVTDMRKIEALFRRFASGTMLWCRLRQGTGSLGAIPVKTPEHARSWIRYWQDMCEIRPGSFTLSEYLPGRDFCVQSLWRSGKLVCSKMHQRIDYHVAGGGPSSVSSTAAFAKTMYEPRVARICAKAIRKLDPGASGVFFVDLKENESGVPCITEINAGRFANVPTIHDRTARPNMALAYVRVALGERVAITGEPAAGQYYVLRDLDTVPAVIQVGKASRGIRDATRAGRLNLKEEDRRWAPGM